VGLCSGHIWAELRAAHEAGQAGEVALIRVEELYPFPREALLEVLEKYSRADEVLWIQEEPRNMGAWNFVERQMRGSCELRYVGRPESASPAEGWAVAHHAEQQRIISEVLSQTPTPTPGGVASHAR
jgi:2-oxoglutarate dehydrogenase E1 component